MDQKVSKSQKRIIHTFIEMRKTIPLERITVTSLVKKADVNKSTFYVYYHDIYDLSEQLESQLVDTIIASIRHPELIATDTIQFTKELYQSFSQQEQMIMILFTNGHTTALPERMLSSLSDIYYKIHPELQGDLPTDIALRYIIYGGFYTFKDYINNNQP